jgi:hypothetical protein
MNSTIRSNNFRLARRAGLKTTISRLQLRASAAVKMAILNVFPNLRGVLTSISDGVDGHSFFDWIFGCSRAQSER